MPKVVYTTSFKGGSGKTTCLVNVASHLVDRGNRVLCVDTDLEAPGLYAALRFPQRAGDLSACVGYEPIHFATLLEKQGVRAYLASQKKEGTPPYIDVNLLDEYRCEPGQAFFVPADVRQLSAATSSPPGNSVCASLDALVDAAESDAPFDYVLVDCPAGNNVMAAEVREWASESGGLALIVMRWSVQQVLGTCSFLESTFNPNYVPYRVVPGSVPSHTDEISKGIFKDYLEDINNVIATTLGGSLKEEHGIPESETLKWRERVLAWGSDDTTLESPEDRECWEAFGRLTDEIERFFEAS